MGRHEAIFKGDVVRAYLYPKSVIVEVLDVGPEGVTLNLQDDDGCYLVVRRAIVEKVRSGSGGPASEVYH